MESNMLDTLQFVMVAALFADLCLTRGAQVVSWLKTEFAAVKAKL